MKVFYDTEFLEGPQKKKFLGFNIGKTAPTIDLISIGMVNERGDEYYAVSKEFNVDEAWNRFQVEKNVNPDFNKKVYWIRENVLYPIFAEMFQKENPEIWSEDFGNMGNFMGYYERYGIGLKYFKELLKIHGKSRKSIANEVHGFCSDDVLSIDKAKFYNVQHKTVDLYAYYGAYDHVALMWLFGIMMDKPKCLPMFSHDLKSIFQQIEDENVLKTINGNADGSPIQPPIVPLKYRDNYPTQDNAHNALDDALWNKKLYEFLVEL